MKKTYIFFTPLFWFIVYGLWVHGLWVYGSWVRRFMVHGLEGSWVRRFMFFVLCWLTLSLIEFDWARSRIQRSQTPVPNC